MVVVATCIVLWLIQCVETSDIDTRKMCPSIRIFTVPTMCAGSTVSMRTVGDMKLLSLWFRGRQLMRVPYLLTRRLRVAEFQVYIGRPKIYRRAILDAVRSLVSTNLTSEKMEETISVLKLSNEFLSSKIRRNL